MRLLFDQNISYRILKKLPKSFSDCVQLNQVGLKNCNDSDIWQYAHDNNYVIVTFDSDFYDISLLNSSPPKIIWLKTGNHTTQEIADLLIANENSNKEFISNPEMAETAFLVIE